VNNNLINTYKIITNVKRILVSIIFVCLTSILLAQPYNNSWINFSQQYYKFKVAETGIYRINLTTLTNAGIPISSINPQNIQLFARGVEIPIYIEGEGDGVFDGADFIEFFGKYNDGWLDESLYGGGLNHPSPHYSLFNDTINYYLTWNTLTTNNRLTVEADTNYSAYTPINSFIKESIQYYTTGYSAGSNFYYYDGETNYYGGTSFGYVPTEGWFDNYYSLGGSKIKNISTKNTYSSGTNAILNAVILGESNYSGVSTGDHHLRVSVGTNVFDTIFEGYKKIDVQMSIPVSDLGVNTTPINFSSINDLGSGVARQAVSYITLKYPHTLDLEGASFFDKMFIDNNPSEAKSYLNITNFNSTGNVIFYDLTNGKRIKVTPFGSNYKCLVPNSAISTRECYISSDGQVKNITSIKPINGTGVFVDYLTLATDTAFIIITHSSLMAAASDYANYRVNGPGNNPQNPLVFDVENLYDQFAFGIEKHPLAIRNFSDFIVDNWPSKPNYLFLIGKSIKAKESRKNANNFHDNLVPSFGVPASDNMLTSGLNGTLYEPLIPTGRLAAKNSQEVTWYLNKINDYENPDQDPFGTGVNDWMKRILHFGGGTGLAQAQSFMTYLNSFKTTIEDTLFGGNVISYSKSSTAPIQNNLSDSIKDYIGQGVALMTFFGHASATGGFDQNIQDPSLWPDQDRKYPFLLGLGCFAGDIHLQDANSTSEDYVIIEDKGVIGFLSSVDLGEATTLNNYAAEFYRNLSYKNYKGSIGRHIVNTVAQTQQSVSTNTAGSSVTLHGDPSLILNSFDKPDYMIEASTITFNPSVVTSDVDSFNINVLVTNLGRAINDSIILEVIRTYPEQLFADTNYYKLFSGTNYQETISFKLPVDVVKGLGLNVFTITVDAIDAVDESVETNNTVIKTLNILSGEIVPIYPYEFMIVPNQGITLKASTAFPFEPAKDYLFEIDTTDYFNSPIKEVTTINHVGGVVSWSPLLLQSIPDSTVFFWRVSKDSVDLTGYNWRGRSFQYIQGKEGWQQDHFFQFENDEFQFVQHNRPTRLFDFSDNVKQLKGVTNGDFYGIEWHENAYYIDTDLIGRRGWSSNCALHVAVIDALTLEPWSANDRNVGQVNTSGLNNSSIEKLFIFHHNNAAEMTALESFLQDTIPNGNHILMWTWYASGFSGFASGMPPSLRTLLGGMGATQLPTVTDSLPFLFYTTKGNGSSTVEVIGDSINHKNLILTETLTASANYANIFSEILGPALSWDSLSWRMSPLEFPTSKDSSVLNVYGVDASGNDTLLINNLPTDSGNIRITNRVDANLYPYLKLNTFLSDDSLFTAPQLNRWHVTYEDVPEAALDPSIFFTFQNDTVDEGVGITVSIAVKNISRYDMDSLLISFAVMDKNNGMHFLPYQRQKPLLADSIFIATINFSTLGLPGLNSLLIDVNPNNDQLEKYHFNNVAQIPFYVNEDNINPILDVTFDGVHILNGDIVSPKADIVIEVTDENQFLLLNDTSDYAVYVTNPNGVEERIYFFIGGVEKMQFIPASLPKNNSKIIFQADFPVDGKYKLRVQANDRTKNNSGNFDYIIEFEVVKRSTITNIINYPNPFTTSTRFVFTLTGSEIPDIFKIQIMTITGKVVREIHKDELGPMNIGRNISQFAWDGTDTYGDRLANGLYLYRVITQINDEEIELRETSIDSYFKKGFGKMYLFR
jgi:hypothetical protein